MTLEIIPILGLGDFGKGDDIADALTTALKPDQLREGDVVVVTHKIVSKAEGAVAKVLSEEERTALVESEAVSIVRRRGELIIAETKHGFVCANAGVDRSNTDEGTAVLLPDDPDRSAHRIRSRLEKLHNTAVAVIISDTFGRPFRRGLTDIAIGISGLEGVVDHKGEKDWKGRTLEVTEIAVADELASAADLVMGKSEGIPAAVVRGYEGPRGDGRGADLIRPVEEELFR